MPAWAISLLVALVEATAKAALPIALQILQKSGMITKAQKIGIDAGTHILITTASIATDLQKPYIGDEKPEIVTNLKDSNGNPVGG